MTRMRVTLVNRLAGIQRGGGEIYDLSLAAALQRAGATVDLITGRPLLRQPIALPPDLPSRIVRTPYLRGLAHRLGAPGWRLLDLDLLLFERGAERILRAADPAPGIVQVTGLPRLARRLERRGTSRVVLLFPGPPSPRHREEIRSCRTVAGVGAVTPYLRERFGREIRDMTGGVDAEAFRPGRASLRERLGIP
ncbi:MAG TPA: hypothetical protein VNI57_01380, partial [Candidatus Saccharimonadales bacterium]|nr:hypothetical protein [Candidatus Saccharimonadales bacterium]